MMNQEVKTRWLHALRSGTYQQTIGELHREVDDADHPAGYCCLGVLCDILGTQWRQGDVSDADDVTLDQDHVAYGGSGYLPHWAMREAALGSTSGGFYSTPQLAEAIAKKARLRGYEADMVPTHSTAGGTLILARTKPAARFTLRYREPHKSDCYDLGFFLGLDSLNDDGWDFEVISIAIEAIDELDAWSDE